MNIDKNQLQTLWLENEKGNKIPCKFESVLGENRFKYQHSMFPCILHHKILEKVDIDEVNKCSHSKKYIKRTWGWVEGMKGRECCLCHGTQVIPEKIPRPKWILSFIWPKIPNPWPKKWYANGSREIMSFESSWPQDLVLAMANSGDYSLSESILIAAQSCERCMNALAYKYGLNWGYSEGSEDWWLCGTSCNFCSNR